jgi:hypothetical protein
MRVEFPLAALKMKSPTEVAATTSTFKFENEMKLYSKLERVGRRFDQNQKTSSKLN